MSIFSDIQRGMLNANLDRKHVKDRPQAGRRLSYLESWHVIAEANRIFGFDGWSRETVEMAKVYEAPTKIGEAQKDGWRVGYLAKVRVVVFGNGESIAREGTGYGSGIDADLGSAHESAAKEAESDAGKRALMTFGNPFGLALYDKTQEHVEAAATPPPRAAPTTKAPAPIKPPHDFRTGEVLPPHMLPTKGSFLEWGAVFIAAVKTAATHTDLDAWRNLNTAALARIAKEAPSQQYKHIQAALTQQAAKIGPLDEPAETATIHNFVTEADARSVLDRARTGEE